MSVDVLLNAGIGLLTVVVFGAFAFVYGFARGWLA